MEEGVGLTGPRIFTKWCQMPPAADLESSVGVPAAVCCVDPPSAPGTLEEFMMLREDLLMSNRNLFMMIYRIVLYAYGIINYNS